MEAVREALNNMVPVRVGAGVGFEDTIMENRRILLKSGRTVDVRHAYALPPDDEVASVGPIDPQIGVLKLEASDGKRWQSSTTLPAIPFKVCPAALTRRTLLVMHRR